MSICPDTQVSTSCKQLAGRCPCPPRFTPHTPLSVYSQVCAYLIKCKKMTFKDAITLVKKARPSANPNNGFRKQLIEYEYELYGTRLDPSDVENYSNGPSVEPE
eukprot:Rhum_TRINITY_DN13765_c0_g2::Rhum_TRINITY_DN13765_c0_g2_i1::g.64008::m.64008